MKRCVVFVLLMCLVLTGCGAVGKAPAVTAAPTATPLPEPASLQVRPLPGNVDAVNGTLAVSLEKGDVYVNGNNLPEMKVTIHAYELYDAVDMSALKVGDSILRMGQDLPVSSIETAENGDIVINGGLDVGGHVFRPGDGGTYYEVGYNDAKSYYVVGETVFPMADEFCFVDKSDLDSEPQNYYLDSFFVDDLFGWYFFPSNTTIRIENGIVVAMERVYIP